MQGELAKILAQGSQILEVRRLRASLEEIFVAMALKGGRK
jgi:hypothetical protein